MININKYSERLVGNLLHSQAEYANEVAHYKGKLPRSLSYFDHIKMAIIRRPGWKQTGPKEFEFANGKKLLIEKNSNINDGCLRLTDEFYKATIKIAEIEIDWLTRGLSSKEREKLLKKGLEEVNRQLEIEDTSDLIPFIRKKIK